MMHLSMPNLVRTWKEELQRRLNWRNRCLGSHLAWFRLWVKFHKYTKGNRLEISLRVKTWSISRRTILQRRLKRPTNEYLGRTRTRMSSIFRTIPTCWTISVPERPPTWTSPMNFRRTSGKAHYRTLLSRVKTKFSKTSNLFDSQQMPWLALA